MAKRVGNKQVVSQKDLEIPKKFNIETVQQSVPIHAVHEKYNLIETYPKCFVKLYSIGDNNYMTAPDEEQREMWKGWRRLLNSMGHTTEFAVTINNRTMNEDDIREANMYKETGDEFDHLRKQMNDVIMRRVADGKNSIRKDKYLTIAVHEESPALAARIFSRLDNDVDTSLKRISSSAEPMSLLDTLDVLYGIYNDPSEHFVQKTKVINDDGKLVTVSSFDFDNMRRQGLIINDLIGPASIDIQTSKIRMGKKWLRALRLTDMPSQLSDNFLSNISDMNFNCLTTINYKPMTTKEADVLINSNLTMIKDEIAKQRRTGYKYGIYDDSYVNPDFLDREGEASLLRDDVRQRDERLFKTTLTIVVFADTEEKLDQYTDVVITECKKASAQLTVMSNKQEEGFNATLPLCYNVLKNRRTLKSSSAAILLPFSILELNDPDGINYSCNLVSKNLLVYDRMASDNFNGFILGSSGSGKSFSAKLEMMSVFLKRNADIVVIDPENEYGALAQMLGGEIIKIQPGGANHINPLDITTMDNSSDSEEKSPLHTKIDFLLRLFECILKSPFGTSSVQENIIAEVIQGLYAKFVLPDGTLDYIPPEEMPTLTDLQQALQKRGEPEARDLSMALKMYTGDGFLNVFGSRSNVDVNSRFVVYQINNIGDRLKAPAMLTILDHIWNQILANKKIGRETWFYVDEIYLLFQDENSAKFLNELFRRARKYLGVPTGITQNVSPILESPIARDMLQNCSFIEILKQAGPDREKLQDLLNLSDTQLEYITSSPKGQGLLYTGQNKAVVPFYSSFPKDNDCYRALTSDAKEIKQIELEKKKAAARQNRVSS